MRRVVIAELLDTDSGSPSEIAASLADLRWFNRWFGGIPTTQSMVEQVAQQTGKRSLTLLEVAAGAGYVPESVRAGCASRGIQLDVALLDRAISHLRPTGETKAVSAEATALPFANGSFDLVSCCLFAHHLSPKGLAQFVKEGLRVCRSAVLINDLIRHPLHLAWAYAGLPLYRSRITRHDAPASVRQAYTVAEMQEIAQKAGPRGIDVRRHFLFRMGVIVWKS